jgi:hypothetical protein
MPPRPPAPLTGLFAVILAAVLFGPFGVAGPQATATGPQKPKADPVDPDHAAKMAKGSELFRSAVRGILQAKCLKCHSGERLEGELDMGSREGLLKGGSRGPAVVPHDHKKSLLWQMTAHQREPAMPYERPKLPDADIQKIAEWIDLGAPYDRPFVEKDDGWTRKVVSAESKKHWAYQPLGDAKPPADGHPVDAFLRAKLTAAKLVPNPPAEPTTLLRRVYLDLIGLPPTPEQVEAYLRDDSPQAFEKVVDALLASPHFGEKQARHWLDLVRFAESHGFEHDYDRPTAYHYRDFVIKAFNQDLPFDTFCRWQLAGDELAPDEPLAMMATGYLAAGVHSTQITKNEVEKHRYDELDDIVNNLGTTFLGLTIGCARCHDHKYDAIPAADYYRLVSAFTTVVRTEVELDLDPAGYAKAKAEFDARHQTFVEAVARYEREHLPARFAAWEKARGDRPLSFEWVVPTLLSFRSSGGATLTPQADGSVLVGGKNPTTEVLTFEFATTEVGIRALRLEALADPALVKGGPGRAANGNFALSDLKVSVRPKDRSMAATAVKLVNPRATFEQNGFGVAGAIDADGVTSAWAIDPQFGKDHAAAFDFAEPVGFPGGTVLTVTLGFHNNTGHGIGRPRVSLSTAAKPSLTAPPVTEALREALATPAEKRTAEQTALAIKWFGPQDAEYARLLQAERDHRATAPKPNKVKALVSSEGLPPVRLHSQGEDFLQETHFLRRGDPAQKDGVAPVGFLQVLMPHPEASTKWLRPAPPGSRTTWKRAALARWLTDTDGGAGHLLARVIVNRLWQQHFGRGLVSTPSDFGVRGEPPTHPELLDFLARELIRHGWRLKPIHRLLVTSAAYRQSSTRDPHKARIDPDNTLVWRQPVRRLTAEVIRDSILFVGGKLNTTMYGPGHLSEESPRRSIYFTIKRSKLIPALVVFDAPDGTVGVGERPSTTVAPQALHLMNNPHVRGAAHGFARKLLADPSISDADAIRRAYRSALCREPTPDELADGVAFLKGKPDRQTALADFCQVLFCLNEFLYVY